MAKNADYRKYNDRSHNSSTYHKKDGTDIRAKLKQETNKEVNEYMQTQDVLLEDIPPELRGTLSYMAHERGHSAGESEVLMILEGLVYDFKKPLQELINRIRLESTK